MKKLGKILMIAIITMTASTARAQGPEINFDGRAAAGGTRRAVEFLEDMMPAVSPWPLAGETTCAINCMPPTVYWNCSCVVLETVPVCPGGMDYNGNCMDYPADEVEYPCHYGMDYNGNCIYPYGMPPLPVPQSQADKKAPLGLSNMELGACSAYCQFGMSDDCSCKEPEEYIWGQHLGEFGDCPELPHGVLGGVAKCSPVDPDFFRAKTARPRDRKSGYIGLPAVQKRLQDILYGYCDTYPEFAAAVLPMLRDGGEIAATGGAVYIIGGSKVMRIAGGGSSWVGGLPVRAMSAMAGTGSGK